MTSDWGNDMSKSIAVAVVCGFAVLVAAQGTAFAQAGSTGGTIGKTDKSESGGEEKTEIKRPAQREELSSPSVIRFSEHGLFGEYTATLRRVGGNEYAATWNVAVTPRMIVRMTKDAMTVQRSDTSNLSGILASVTYSGTRTGNTASGSFNGGINRGTWDASW
jgi:hypothetical protein